MSNTHNDYATCRYCGDVRFMKRLRADGWRTCRSCAAKRTNVRSNSASKGGKAGGRKTAETGKLKIASVLAHSTDAEFKRHETLKRKGLLFSSKPENELHQLLVEKFGNDNVIHHLQKNRFRIDFHIITHNVYIQLDGLYWHGLTAPYEKLNATQKRKYDVDRQCDEFFKQNDLKLVRITDAELRESRNAVIDKIEQSIRSST